MGVVEAGFETVAEVSADDRSRVSLMKAGVKASERYSLARSASGQILLTPLTSIPRRELLIWQDEQVRASLQRGIAEAAAGLVEPAPNMLDELDSG